MVLLLTFWVLTCNSGANHPTNHSIWENIVHIHFLNNLSDIYDFEINSLKEAVAFGLSVLMYTLFLQTVVVQKAISIWLNTCLFFIFLQILYRNLLLKKTYSFETVLVTSTWIIFISLFRHLQKERKCVNVQWSNWHFNVFINQKVSCTLFAVLSLLYPNRQRERKCCFTNISKSQTACVCTLLINWCTKRTQRDGCIHPPLQTIWGFTAAEIKKKHPHRYLLLNLLLFSPLSYI